MGKKVIINLIKISSILMFSSVLSLYGCSSSVNNSSDANVSHDDINTNSKVTLNAMGSIIIPAGLNHVNTDTWVHNDTESLVSVNIAASFNGKDVTSEVISHQSSIEVSPHSSSSFEFTTPNGCSDGGGVILTIRYITNGKTQLNSATFTCEDELNDATQGIVFGGFSPSVYGSDGAHYVTLYATGSGNNVIYDDLKLVLPAWIQVSNNNFAQKGMSFASNEVQALEIEVPGNSQRSVLELQSKAGNKLFTSSASIIVLPVSKPHLTAIANVLFDSSKSKTAVLNLVNPGIEPVNVTNITSSNNNLTIGQNSCTNVAPGASCTINVSIDSIESALSSSIIMVSYTGVNTQITDSSSVSVQWYNKTGFQPIQITTRAIFTYETLRFVESVTITNPSGYPVQLPAVIDSPQDLTNSATASLSYASVQNACVASQILEANQSCTIELSMDGGSTVLSGNLLFTVPFIVNGTTYTKYYLVPYQILQYAPNLVSTTTSIYNTRIFGVKPNESLLVINTGPVATTELALSTPSLNSTAVTANSSCDPQIRQINTLSTFVSTSISPNQSCVFNLFVNNGALSGSFLQTNFHLKYRGGLLVSPDSKSLIIPSIWLFSQESVSVSAIGSRSGTGLSSSSPFVFANTNNVNQSVTFNYRNTLANKTQITSFTNNNSTTNWSLESTSASRCQVGTILNTNESCTVTFRVLAITSGAVAPTDSALLPIIKFDSLTPGTGQVTSFASTIHVKRQQAEVVLQRPVVTDTLESPTLLISHIATNISGYSTFQINTSSATGYVANLLMNPAPDSGCSATGLNTPSFTQTCDFALNPVSSESLGVRYKINKDLNQINTVLLTGIKNDNGQGIIFADSQGYFTVLESSSNLYVTDFTKGSGDKFLWFGSSPTYPYIKFNESVPYPSPPNSSYVSLGTTVSGNYLYLMLGTTWVFNAPAPIGESGMINICNITPSTGRPDCMANRIVPLPNGYTSWHPIDIYARSGYAYIVDDLNQKTWIYSIAADGSLSFTGQQLSVPFESEVPLGQYTPVSVTGQGSSVYIGYNAESGTVNGSAPTNPGRIYRYTLESTGVLSNPYKLSMNSTSIFGIRVYNNKFFVIHSNSGATGVIANNAANGSYNSSYYNLNANNMSLVQKISSFTGDFMISFASRYLIYSSGSSSSNPLLSLRPMRPGYETLDDTVESTVPRPSYLNTTTINTFGPKSTYPAIQY